jgi:tetratricopeptide (TPR) repeat protein
MTVGTRLIRTAAFLLLWGLVLPGHSQEAFSVLTNHWFEARTPHFQTYSCGLTQEVAKLTARLEQFRAAYEALAGTQGVASPAIKVIALPDHESLKHFVPLYHGEPSNLSGFFHRGSDENLIVLGLTDSGTGSLDTIFHEYAHLLLRRNQQFWPMWLNEGMADIYATFEVTGDHSVSIGKPRAMYLRVLSDAPLLPLSSLFAVTHESPDYNERERQGMFYAESWLLTHFLMIGNPAHRAHFGELTRLLRQGQTSEQAFTNAFRLPLPVMQKQLEQYLKQDKFDSLSLGVRASLLTAQPMATRGIGSAEVCCRLGDELFRVGREDEAEAFLLRAAKLAPANPLAHESIGLLQAERGRHQEAEDELTKSIDHGSKSFLAHYAYAREKLILSAPTPDTYTRLPTADAAAIQKELETSLELMPEFAPTHQLLGFLELLQGDNLADAARHLKKAAELEPENPSYLLTLAQVQIAGHDPRSARGTLESLRHSYVDDKVRARAEEMLKAMSSAQ